MDGFIFSRGIDKAVDEAREGRRDMDQVTECNWIYIFKFMIPEMYAASF